MLYQTPLGSFGNNMTATSFGRRLVSQCQGRGLLFSGDMKQHALNPPGGEQGGGVSD